MSKKLIIGIIIAFAVVAALLLLLLLTPPENAEPPEDGAKSLTDFALEDITGIDLKRQDISYAFRKTQSRWVLENDETFDLDQERALAVAANCAYLSVQEMLGGSADKTKLGLEPAQTEATVYFKDGATKKLRIGAQTMDKTGWYAMREDTGAIAVIPGYAGQVFTYTKDALFNRSVGEINWGRFHSVRWIKPGAEAIAIEANPKAQNGSQDLSGLFLVTSPFKGYAKPDRIKILFDDLSKLKFDEYLGNKADLKPFGLDAPRLHCLIEDSQGSKMEFSAGSSFEKDGSLFYYCNRPGDPQNVFIMTGEKAAFGNTAPISLVDTALFPGINAGNIKNLSITAQEGAYEVAFTENGGTVNGKSISKELADAIKKSYSSVAVTAAADAGVKGKPVITLKAGNGAETYSVDVYPFNDALYAVDQGFGQYFCITRTSADTLAEQVKKLQ